MLHRALCSLCVVLFVGIVAPGMAAATRPSAGVAEASESDVPAASGTEEVLPDTKPLLAIMGKRFPLDLTGGELTVHGIPVFIAEKPNTGEGTGHTVWDGGVVLAKYLEVAFPSGLVGKTVLELGAGTGIVGVVASVLGAERVILSDLDYVMETLKDTVERNRDVLRGEVECLALDWTAPSDVDALGPIDVVLASDVVWVQDLIVPFVNTLARITAAGAEGKAPTVLLSHQTRSTAGDEALFRELGAKGLVAEEVPLAEHHSEFRAEPIHIYRITRGATRA